MLNVINPPDSCKLPPSGSAGAILACEISRKYHELSTVVFLEFKVGLLQLDLHFMASKTKMHGHRVPHEHRQLHWVVRL